MMTLQKKEKKRNFDKYAIDKTFNVGDRVLIFKEDLEAMKFNWNGPFKVLEDIGNHSYKIEDGNGRIYQRYGGHLFPYTANYGEQEIEAEMKQKRIYRERWKFY